ncbi:MAG: acyltransferase family protein [Bryobacteraceae bacterium]
MKRFPFLDWMRGLAVVIMIECHAFNAFARMDTRDGGPYVLSQFVGGMAAPLFLFMAGMTTAFQMESMARRAVSPWRRWVTAMRRAGYIMVIALLFRFTNWLGSLPGGSLQELTKVDILNCMAVALAAFAAAAAFGDEGRMRFAVLGAAGVAMLSPLMANLPWDWAPPLLREYLVPSAGRGHFPFFPCASYVGFGIAAGLAVKRTADARMDRLMQWSVLIGIALIFTNQYFSNLPYSIYPKSNFWTDSPTLVLIRTGVILACLAGSYLWTEYGAGAGWSWMQTLGKTSLMVYWVHVVLVYGGWTRFLHHNLTISQTAVATVSLGVLMVGLAAAKLWWTGRRAARPQLVPATERA